MRRTRLMSWLSEHSIPSHNLEIADFPGPFPGQQYRGLRTKTDVKGGELLLQIPRELLLSQESARYTSGPESIQTLFQELLREGVLPGKIIMALHILREYFDPNSKWAPWLRLLPSQEGNLLYFSDYELQQMQCPPTTGCPVVEKARAVHMELRKVWESLHPVMTKIQLVPNGQFTYENFQWAYLTVISRVFSVEVTKRYGFGLVDGREQDFGTYYIAAPFADFLNHHNTEPALQFTYGFNDETKMLEVFADQDYNAGDQVYISYGVLTNPDMLLNYGYIMPDNIFESIGLRLEMENTTPHVDMKRELLLSHGLVKKEKTSSEDANNSNTVKNVEIKPDGTMDSLLHAKKEVDNLPNDFLTTHINLVGEPSEQFLSALRIKAYTPTPEELSLIAVALEKGDPLSEALPDINPTKPIDSTNEFEVQHGLLMNLEQLLAVYPTTLQEDVALAKNPSTISHFVSSRFYMALMLRIEVKRVLHAALLECFRGIKAAFDLVAAEQRPNAVQEMEKDMWKHWDKGILSWSRQWKTWRSDIDSVWGRTESLRNHMNRSFNFTDLVNTVGDTDIKSILHDGIALRGEKKQQDNKNQGNTLSKLFSHATKGALGEIQSKVQKRNGGEEEVKGKGSEEIIREQIQKLLKDLK
eukprot:g5686.t1